MSLSAVAQVSSFLLELHDKSNELGYRELHRFTLQRFQALMAFDAGMLAMGTVQNGDAQAHDVVLDRVSAEVMASWEKVKHQDRVALWSFTHPGRSGAFDTAGEIYEGFPEIQDHCRRFGLAHILCTCMISADAGLYWVMSVYRSDPSKPFSEDERQAMELMVPHVFSAGRRARLGELRSRSRVAAFPGHVAAIAKPSGLILEAEPEFTGLIRQAWPKWSGPQLPSEVVSGFTSGATSRVAQQPVVVRADPADELVLLHARKMVAADELTTREREIAEAFSLGETHREIGERLGVAPNTVRRHLANIYEKLGIASKAELDRMISGLG